MKKIPLHRVWAGLFIFLVLGLTVWRYLSIPAPIKPYDGKTRRLTLEAAGFSAQAPYGKQVKVRLFGVEGTLYYSDVRDFAPGDRLGGYFRVDAGYRQGGHFKATTSFAIDMEENVPRLKYKPVIWARAIKERVAALYSGDGAALLTGILTGDKTSFSEELTQDLFTSGMTHIAAVSGLHVSALAGFIALTARSRRRSFLVSLPLVFLYAAITGFTPSAVRAGIMLAVYTAAPLFGREYTALRALTAALLVSAAINPFALFQPSLQLSFSAALGLILFAKRWQEALEKRKFFQGLPKKAARFIASSLASSFAALVFSLPFAAYWFGGVSLPAPLSNLLLLWLVNIVFIGGALSLILPFLVPAAAAALALFRAVTALLSALPYAVLYTARPYMLAWLLYAYAMFVIMILTGRRKAPGLLSLAAFIVCLSLTVWRDGRVSLEIAVLDVGQGQCVVVRSGGQTAVIDCGGVNAGRTAARFLQSRGVGKLDYLLLTHYDNDHTDGLPALLAYAGAGTVYGPDLEGAPGGVSIQTPAETISLGRAEIFIIPSLWHGDGNDRGLSFLVAQDGFFFLVTGDLGQAGERWLLRAAGLPGADVIVAGHHGSAGSVSEELLDALSPQAAVISTGPNSYGHPAPATLERLMTRDIAVYRTDSSGHVIIRR